MGLQTFVDKGGFKLLAVSRLSSGSYGLVCYLVNCMAAGVEEIVSSVGELSVLLGIPERHVKLSVEELEECNIVVVTRPAVETSRATASAFSKPLALCLNLNVNGWKNLRKTPVPRKNKGNLGDAKNIHPLRPQAPRMAGKKTSLHQVPSEELDGEQGARKVVAMGIAEGGLSPKEALVFPAKKRSGAGSELKSSGGTEGDIQSVAMNRVVESFAEHKDGQIDQDKEREYAELLCENHPTEQILELIGAFGKEIPSLGLLAGAWAHFSERFLKLGKEEISLDAFRKKNSSMEKRLRQLAQNELKRAQNLKVTLSEEEQILLRIFCRHEQPRKQLYWALAVKERYPHLSDFFAATLGMALKPGKK